MNWWILIGAGVLEIVWSVGLKFTGGFKRLGPSVVVVAAMIASTLLLERAVRTLPIGTAYAVWVGIGAVGAVIGGIWLFDEPVSVVRLSLLGLLILSIVGLRLTAS